MTTRYGARNQIEAKVTAVKTGDVMSQVKLESLAPVQLASVMTTESLEALGLEPGDKVSVIVKAIHVLVVKE